MPRQRREKTDDQIAAEKRWRADARRLKRAQATSEQRAERLAQDRESRHTRRQQDTDQVRDARIVSDREAKRAYRAAEETPEARAERHDTEGNKVERLWLDFPSETAGRLARLKVAPVRAAFSEDRSLRDEMRRLRNHKLPTVCMRAREFMDKADATGQLSVAMLNVQSLNAHHLDVTGDNVLIRAHLLILCETCNGLRAQSTYRAIGARRTRSGELSVPQASPSTSKKWDTLPSARRAPT
ncbi:hypothetical protein HPB49_021697 [Dermacentor silvarum]|uniref:Uncharacterized protein n=1 Tax=Dermacentor silvarum TaxID=543639 RepID=A0ACB8DQI3_DERSI|nr:hypothetical protein HPB49_021697 [Dermacentor silvarum]